MQIPLSARNSITFADYTSCFWIHWLHKFLVSTNETSPKLVESLSTVDLCILLGRITFRQLKSCPCYCMFLESKSKRATLSYPSLHFVKVKGEIMLCFTKMIETQLSWVVLYRSVPFSWFVNCGIYWWCLFDALAKLSEGISIKMNYEVEDDIVMAVKKVGALFLWFSWLYLKRVNRSSIRL